MQVKGKWNDIHPEAEIGEGTDIWGWNYIGKCKIGKRCQITNWVHIGDGCIIGDDCNFQPHSYLTSNVKMGNRVFVAGGVQLTDIKYLTAEKNQIREPITIGDDVVLANGVRLLAGITVGDGAVLAMGAVVTRDIPAGEVWLGVPAKFHCARKIYEEKKRQHEADKLQT